MDMACVDLGFRRKQIAGEDCEENGEDGGLTADALSVREQSILMYVEGNHKMHEILDNIFVNNSDLLVVDARHSINMINICAFL